MKSDEMSQDFDKFKDEQIRSRELDEAVGRFRMGLFVAALGPAAIVTLKYLGALPSLGRLPVYAIYATGPAGIALALLYFALLPAKARTSTSVLGIGLLTVAAAAATFILAGKLSMLGP